MRRSRSIKSWQQTVAWFLVALLLFSFGSLLHPFQQKEKPWENPYVDVIRNMWSYQYITELNRLGVYPSDEYFDPERTETRADLAQHLYRMDSTVFADRKEARELEQKKDKTPEAEPPVFTDVDASNPEDPQYQAICWSCQNQILNGTGDGAFSPDADLTREQVCTVLIRFAAFEGINLAQVVQPHQFNDSLQISQFARSGVTACQMAAVVQGDGEGYFLPQFTMTRQEMAAVLYRVMTAGQAEFPEGVALVDLTPGAYDSLYDSYYVPAVYTQALIPSNGTEVPLAYFDQTVFIGDSVSVMLESYCNSTRALGEAQFLCAGSMSSTSILSGKLLPEYPKGSGETPAIEDSVARSGARVVYLMLGMNNLSGGVSYAANDLVEVIRSILSVSPDVAIVVESVTPMTKDSPRRDASLNNDVINWYNETMQNICQENKWYFLNVAEAFKDENGFLKAQYCSDPTKMGMHFTYEGTKIWVDYLKTHVPLELLQKMEIEMPEAE